MLYDSALYKCTIDIDSNLLSVYVCVCLSADRSMQLNEGRFMTNNRCGYVLQPNCMRHPQYDPYDKDTLNRVKPPIEPLHMELLVSTRFCCAITVGWMVGRA